MKTKITTLILSILVIITSYVVSCTRFPFEDESINNDLVQNLNDDFLYQSGCEEEGSRLKKDSSLNYIYGNSEHVYSTYEIKNNRNVFYGNKLNLLNCQSRVPKQNSWQYENINFQLILILNNNKKITNLNSTITGDNFIYDDLQPWVDKKITGWSRFLKFIKVNPGIKGSKHIPYDRHFLIPDIIGENKLQIMKYDVQPIYVSLKVGDNLTPGEYQLKNKVTYLENGLERSLEIPFTINVKNKSLKGQSDKDNFGFTVQSFPSDGLKDWVGTQPPSPPITEGPTNEWSAWYLKDNAKNALSQYLTPLVDSNSKFTFATGYHKQIIQWSQYFDDKENNKSSYDELVNYMQSTSFENIMNNSKGKIKWEFDTKGLETYLDITSEVGIPQLAISVVENGKFSSWLVDKTRNKTVGKQIDIKAEIINSKNGKEASDYKLYRENILKPLFEKIAKTLDDGYKSGKFILSNGKRAKVMISTDELNESVMYDVKKLIDEVNSNYNSTPIGMNSFIGWRSNVDLTNSDYLNKNFINAFDQYIVHGREMVNIGNKNVKYFREFVKKRKENGLSTNYYTTFNDYPGAYIGSDTSELYWSIFWARSVGMDGFYRWAFDKYYDNYYDKEEFTSSGKEEIREPGQSFLVYGGKEDYGTKWSVRMKALISAVQDVHKINYLLEHNNGTDELIKALYSIGYSEYAHNNDVYKWNPSFEVQKNFSTPTLNYNRTISMQVRELRALVESF